MKKLSLILGVALLSTATLFAGDNNKKEKKEAKVEACSKDKEKGSSCCASKKTTSTATLTSDSKVVKQDNQSTNTLSKTATKAEIRELSSEQLKAVSGEFKSAN